jgi:ABC-type polysaccharide/polyol phosphate export permease
MLNPAKRQIAQARAEPAADRRPSGKRILAIFIARNREFYRDKAGLLWNIIMPMLMIVAFVFIFGSGDRQPLKVGVLNSDLTGWIDGRLNTAAAPSLSGFFNIPSIRFVQVDSRETAINKVARHQLDLVVDIAGTNTYWMNPESANGIIAERLLLSAATPDQGPAGPRRAAVPGQPLSYADWALPGVLAMNVMFSSLWGVGWVVVRYRKNGVLRRLKATPLTPFEFLAAQILSRLLVVLGSSLVVFGGAMLLLDFPMRGSYLALALVYGAGALCMISLGLIVASRLRTEELADGLLNMLSWPMLLLSGVWFSMDGTSAAAQSMSQLMPLTYVVDGARAVMIDGAGMIDVVPIIALLLVIAAILTTIAARLFRWE